MVLLLSRNEEALNSKYTLTPVCLDLYISFILDIPSALLLYANILTTACGGGSVVFTDTSATTKGNFGATQHSVKILSLSPNFHLTFYTGLNQGGDKSQFGSGSVGGCVSNVDYLSYGFYSGA
jgi:hypothetical protein